MTLLWVLSFLVLGGIGLIWAAVHFGHALHHPIWHFVMWGLALWAIVIMAWPLADHRADLTVGEVRMCLIAGSFGIGFLAFELGHKVHHWVVSVVPLVGLVCLWLFWLGAIRPKMADPAIVPSFPTITASPPTASPTPIGLGSPAPAATGAPTAGRQASSGPRPGWNGPPIPKEEVPEMYRPK